MSLGHHLLFLWSVEYKSLMTWEPTIIQLIRAISQLFSHGGKSRNKWEQTIKRMDLCLLSKLIPHDSVTIGIGGRSINLFWPMGEKLIVLTGQLVPPYHPAFSDLTRNLKARLEWSTLGQFSDEWSHYQLSSGLISFNKLLDGSNLKTVCVCVCELLTRPLGFSLGFQKSNTRPLGFMGAELVIHFHRYLPSKVKF